MTLRNLSAKDYALPEDLAARLHSPALVVHLDAARRNARRIIDLCGDVERWRPHLKTTKIPRLWTMLLKLGVRHAKCATLREARVFLRTAAAAGVSDIDLLVAQPLREPALGELGREAHSARSARVSVLCEDPELLPQIPQELSIFVDVNPGMNRTGIPLEEGGEILELARAAGARFRGLHVYEGHLTDRDGAERRNQAFAIYERVVSMRNVLARARIEVGEIVSSGTPALRSALAYEPFAELDGTLHRVSAGTVVLHDARTEEENPGLELEPAALLFTRVISHPAPDLVTCDAGSKSIAAEAGDPCAVVIGHPGLLPQRPSEEHLPLKVISGEVPPRGEGLFLVPRHVCPTVNLAEQAVLMGDGEFVEVAAVAARAHDTLV